MLRLWWAARKNIERRRLSRAISVNLQLSLGEYTACLMNVKPVL